MTSPELRFIRHGDDAHMRRFGDSGGRAFYANLTSEGRQQALKKGFEMKARDVEPTIFATSPAWRCQQTGALALIGLGIANRVPTMEMENNLLARDDAESIADVSTRGMDYLDQQGQQLHLGDSVLAFTHKSLILHTVGALEGWDTDKQAAMSTHLTPLSETRLVLEGDVWHVAEFARPLPSNQQANS